MSTRSMTILRTSRSGAAIHLYRHCDGYPACAGESILEAIDAIGAGRSRDSLETFSFSAADIAGKLLALRYEQQPHEKKARGIYELADWTPAEQGDLEHVYTVIATQHHGIEIMHARRVRWDGPEAAQFATDRYKTLAEFRAMVSREVADMEARHAELAEKCPDIYGAKSDLCAAARAPGAKDGEA